jgi:hypothetical protein
MPNRHKFNTVSTELLIFHPKPALPLVFSVSVNGNIYPVVQAETWSQVQGKESGNQEIKKA